MFWSLVCPERGGYLSPLAPPPGENTPGTDSMLFATRATRKLGLMLIALLSVGAGAVALWGGLSPETFGSARTVDLLIVLGLLLLPAATFIAVVAERRTRRSGARSRPSAPIDAPGEAPGAQPATGDGVEESWRTESGSATTRANANRHRPAVTKRRATGASKS